MTLEFMFQALLRVLKLQYPLHALTNVRSILEMDTLQFVLKYSIFLSRNYRENVYLLVCPSLPKLMSLI